VKDFNLFYSGGSGGFLLLHLLLLTGQYHVVFKNDVSMKSALDGQWKISNPESWKKTETWPDNEKTFHSRSDLTKIYYYCNPDTDIPPDDISYGGRFGEFSDHSVGLYTDYASQTTLAKYKRAFYFDETDQVINQKWNRFRTILITWQEHYDNIRDPSWPECRSFRRINQLPRAIQQELMADPYTQSFLDFEYRSEFQAQEVYLGILPFLESADTTIRLQDLVNHTESVLNQVFDIQQLNQPQKNLVLHWKSLHPADMLTPLGIMPTVV
jgi:hypothetical protein